MWLSASTGSSGLIWVKSSRSHFRTVAPLPFSPLRLRRGHPFPGQAGRCWLCRKAQEPLPALPTKDNSPPQLWQGLCGWVCPRPSACPRSPDLQPWPSRTRWGNVPLLALQKLTAALGSWPECLIGIINDAWGRATISLKSFAGSLESARAAFLSLRVPLPFRACGMTK